MAKSKDKKRYEAIMREVKYWNGYENMPKNVASQCRSSYLKLSLSDRAKLADEIGLKFGTGKLLFLK